MKRSLVFLSTMVLVLGAADATLAVTTIFTNESAFLGAIQSGYYLEEFSGFTYGSFQGPSLGFGPTNGFSYTMSAANGLWSGNGNMSTNFATDPLVTAFTGSAVTAVGGIFWPTDINGGNVVGDIQLSLSDGTNLVVTVADFNTFRGFVSDSAAFTSMSVSSMADEPPYQWPTVDHFYIGQAVPPIPAPAAALLCGIGAGLVGWLRRRRTL